ncbi:lamin tail domain-containing protein 1-like [Xenopus laevis]|uniref:Lamin tail domain-containing protein 1-like n=1 Tax=Xenopus laevis TaxID=8355 RepID=A0A8J1MX99_XENLA|nr:lamin tail domain-containing protein 1-like [Xenopus laevis]
METQHFSRSPCPLKIVEVNDFGHFVRIWNSSPSCHVDLSGYIIWQLEGNHPVSIYRFPQNSFLPACQHVTVWASASKVSHNPPTDLVWKGRLYFRTNPQCITVLSRPSGQPVASYRTSPSLPAWIPDKSEESVQEEETRNHLEEEATKANQTPRSRYSSANSSGSCSASQALFSRTGSPVTPRITSGQTRSPTFVSSYPSRLNKNSPFVKLLAQTSARSKHGFKFLSHVPFTCDLLRR